MFRRACITDAWLLEPDIPFYRDYALWLRLALAHDFVHVDRITACYTIRNAGASQASVTGHDRALAAYRAIYAQYPLHQRPVLEQRRVGILAAIERGELALKTEPAVAIAPRVWPPWRAQTTSA
jgi:hypothetical protein